MNAYACVSSIGVSIMHRVIYNHTELYIHVIFASKHTVTRKGTHVMLTECLSNVTRVVDYSIRLFESEFINQHFNTLK